MFSTFLNLFSVFRPFLLHYRSMFTVLYSRFTPFYPMVRVDTATQRTATGTARPRSITVSVESEDTLSVRDTASSSPAPVTIRRTGGGGQVAVDSGSDDNDEDDLISERFLSISFPFPPFPRYFPPFFSSLTPV